MQDLGHFLRQAVLLPAFRDSKTYWERRYRLGGDSGAGSSGRLAAFKAEVLNGFVRDHGIGSVIEFGCGDGQQLALANYPLYLGLDVARTCIELCGRAFAQDPSKSFLWYDPATTVNLANFVRADLALSLDVIYHLVEDQAYEAYMADLFSSARRYAIVYSSDKDEPGPGRHVRHRNFSADVGRRFPAFRHTETIANRYPDESLCSFFVFERTPSDEEAS